MKNAIEKECRRNFLLTLLIGALGAFSASLSVGLHLERKPGRPACPGRKAMFFRKEK